MNIIIAGDGKVGAALTRQLASEGYDVTVIDSDSRVLDSSVERYDVISVHGNCAAMDTLLEAGVRDADLLIAVTHADEVNLLCCTTAHALNPKLHTIARIRNPEYTDQIFKMRDVFGLSMAINPEKLAAVEMARLIKYPGFLRRDVFAKGRTEIVELKIDRQSKLCDVSLIDMSAIVKCRVLVCAVLRGGVAQVPNSGDFRLREGDRIFVTAPTENLTILLKSLGIITRKAHNVILVGGGRVSYYLAELLGQEGIGVRLIDRDESRCRLLAAELPRASILQGDGSDMELLESEGLPEADALVTATGLDELNMIVSLYGSVKKVPQVITKLSHMENQSILNCLELGSVICPKDLCSNNIVRYVRAMQNQTGAAVSVHAIADGQVEAMEFIVDENTKNCGVPLKHLKPKRNVLIASITRGAETLIANGDSTFQQGDTIVVVTSGRGVIKQLGDIFA
ncbi:MAG: Trk system potassium transporter TrkA [Eubacteriales bacterium]|nr:Trk system potassium transporter TrkA [Eubacteriales bacterium]